MSEQDEPQFQCERCGGLLDELPRSDAWPELCEECAIDMDAEVDY